MRSRIRITAALLVLALLAPLVHAEGIRFAAAGDSRLSLSGDSTLHAYESVSTGFSATADLHAPVRTGDMAALRQAIFNGKMSGFVLQVPVRKLKSAREGLDENLHKALRAPEFPEITFKMTSYEAYSAGEDARILIKAGGQLQVAGKIRDTVITGYVHLSADAFTLSGTKELLMSDFDVHAPVLFLGTVKTDDKIVVHFNLRMVPIKK